MAAEINKDAAINIGYRLGGAPLLEQSTATRALVMRYLQAMKDAGQLTDADIAELDEAVTVVHKWLGDYALSASEAHSKTAELASIIHHIKSSRRNLMNSVERVFRHQPQYDDFRRGTYHGTNVAELCVDLIRKIAFAREHVADLAPVGISNDFLTKFETEVHDLERSSGDQDQKLSSLSAQTRAFCEAKGRLYFLLRNLNNAGRAYHCEDPELAAQFNLKLLYRRPRSKAEKQEPTPVSPTPLTPMLGPAK
jgi:hypothetical protein